MLFPFPVHIVWGFERSLPNPWVALFDELQRTLRSNVVGITCSIAFSMESAFTESAKLLSTLMAGVQADNIFGSGGTEMDMFQMTSCADP